MSEELLEAIKAYLNFTWTDERQESLIEGYANSSIQYLEEVAGTEIDFDTDYLARDLLFNRVLYMYSQALDDFGNNYNGMINELKIKYVEEETE